MARSPGRLRPLTCPCGQVVLEAVDAPIVAAVCHCTSCRTARERIEALPGAPAMAEDDGGTPFVLYRKDRVRCIKGAELLREYRLTPAARTRRVLAQCCNAPMFLEFERGHWLSLYRQRFAAADQPALEMRVMTGKHRAGFERSDDMPSYASHSGRFMWKLLSAWIAMGFRAPKIDYVKGGVGHYAG
ncbi:hypothetical protein FZC33_33930 [Labrys sp. KNU-23]|uniref:GFA family protein n=1 Tax=Labrys sp. KNU-23 TaxID=2789216 RepID=UPI0011F0053B|nr:hypothetical protein [Labrys sp. KNU-23]QEN90993.1 hypothetical protein FZC33_33930 [Labrys sp. KNU-23]